MWTRNFLLFSAAVACVGAVPVRAAVVGTDDTTATAYADGWSDGDDGAVTGDAFTSWRLFTGGTAGNAGFFEQNSTTLSNSNGSTGTGGDINAGGTAWGLFGTGDGTADAYRDFNGSLSVGQTFSIDLAVNFRNGYKGIDLRSGTDADNDRVTIFNFNTGSDDYVVSDASSGNGSIGNAYSDDTVFDLAFTQTTDSGGTWTITRSGGVTDLDTGTYSGVATGFHLYVGDTDGGDPNDLYANNLSIVPEPASVGLLGLATLAGLRRRRR